MPGKFVGLDGCSHEARGVAAASPGFTTSQGRRWVRLHPKGSMALASPHRAFLACVLSQPRSVRINQNERPLCIGAGLIVRSVVGSVHGGRSVGELPSFVATCSPASGAACYCATGAARFVILGRPACGWARIKGGMDRWLLKRARQVCRARRAKNSAGEQLAGAPRLPPQISDGATSSCASGSIARSIYGSQLVPTASRSPSLASAFLGLD